MCRLTNNRLDAVIPRRTLRPRQGDGSSHIGTAHVAFGRHDSLGPCDFRYFVAQSHTPHDHCVRFAVVVTSHDATLVTRRPLPLTWTGLSPAGPRQLRLAHHDFSHCRARAATTPADTCIGAQRRKLPVAVPPASPPRGSDRNPGNARAPASKRFDGMSHRGGDCSGDHDCVTPRPPDHQRQTRDADDRPVAVPHPATWSPPRPSAALSDKSISTRSRVSTRSLIRISVIARHPERLDDSLSQ
jgi:hypothetical protein